MIRIHPLYKTHEYEKETIIKRKHVIISSEFPISFSFLKFSQYIDLPLFILLTDDDTINVLACVHNIFQLLSFIFFSKNCKMYFYL